MPYKSKSQQRFFFAAEARGELKPGTAREWAHKTKNIKKLPEHIGDEEKKAGVLDALEKFAAFTPAFIRSVARDGDVEVDQPEFKEKCRSLTGEAHLDKMSAGQLGQVAKMLWSKEASARKEHKPAAHKPAAHKPAAHKPETAAAKKKKPDEPLAMLGKGVVGAATPIAANTAAMLLAHEAPRTGTADFSKEKQFRSLEEAMGQSGTRKVEGPYAGMGEIGRDRGASGKADWGVVLPKGTSEAVAGHELGHRANWKAIDSVVGKPASRGLFRAALMSQGLTSAASIPLSAYTATDPNMSWTPGAVQLGVSAPRLLDEAAASLHAVRHLIGKYGLGKGLREGVRLAPAFGTYAAIAGAPIGITAARRAWRHVHPDNE